jgi:hypothetical protein
MSGGSAGCRGDCPHRKPFLAPLAAFPPPAPVSASAASPARTLDLAERTLREAEATWLMTAAVDGRGSAVAGLVHGTAVTSLLGITLSRYAIESGVSVSGRLAVSGIGPPVRFTGTLTVRGPRAAAGTVSVDGEQLRGVLGGAAIRRQPSSPAAAAASR